LIVIEPITPRNVDVFKEVRLRALREDPNAFGSTYAREVQFDDAEWARRVERWNGERGVGFVAMDDSTPCGIAGSLLDEADATRAQLVSMWIASTHRQLGVGRLLVNEVLNWARTRRIRTMLLMVVSNNDSAIRFYERLGFLKTGRTDPYPNDPAIVEYEMARALP
jgi:ribosomal protein S18 acetylase RimI-like enzyme